MIGQQFTSSTGTLASRHKVIIRPPKDLRPLQVLAFYIDSLKIAPQYNCMALMIAQMRHTLSFIILVNVALERKSTSCLHHNSSISGHVSKRKREVIAPLSISDQSHHAPTPKYGVPDVLVGGRWHNSLNSPAEAYLGVPRIRLMTSGEKLTSNLQIIIIWDHSSLLIGIELPDQAQIARHRWSEQEP